MWRNLLAVPLLAPVVLRRPVPLAGRERRLIVLSGLLLAAHFATWIPSISYTSVASSVALVATQPAWTAVFCRIRGEPVATPVWAGIGLAFLGVVVLTGVDLSTSSRALLGDLLALVGGALAAAYVMVGAEVRRSVGVAVYSSGCYLVAGVSLAVTCVVSGQPLSGYGTDGWAAIIGLVLGAQLLGHTLFNLVLRTLSPVTVSVSILFEVVGATVLAAWWFGETPPLAAIPAGVLIFTGVLVVIRAGRSPAD